MPTAHLICGPIGAGKTTHALKLCAAEKALHFSIDEWMVRLFGPDMPAAPGWGWIEERTLRAENQILDMAAHMAPIGIPCVLDLGFLTRDQRRRVAAAVTSAGFVARLHVFDIDSAERWRRVQARNAARGETYRLCISRPMFDFVETLWQPPTPEEMAALDGLRIAA